MFISTCIEIVINFFPLFLEKCIFFLSFPGRGEEEEKKRLSPYVLYNVMSLDAIIYQVGVEGKPQDQDQGKTNARQLHCIALHAMKVKVKEHIDYNE